VKQDYRQLFQPKIINSVSGLSLIARVIVEGYLSGAHQSKRVGPGLEFSQYRGYQPGDDMRLLDWKMLARSGRFYIKESEIDTQVAVKFIVDASASMLHEEEGLSKMDYVRVLVASLTHLSHKQGDATGLFSLNNSRLRALHPTSHKQHYNRLLHELIKIEGSGNWPSDRHSVTEIHHGGQKELLFVITDMYEQNGELTQWIQSLKTSKNEVVVLQVLGKNELEFNYTGALVFEDLETGKRVKVNAKNSKAQYLKEMEAALVKTKNFFLSNTIGHEVFRLDSPMEEALQLFLKKRMRLN
jgi:uncharacterized protein (DUF58 family)